MKLQELVNNLSNKLASMSGDTTVYVKVAGNQETAGKVVVEDTKDGLIIIIN